MSDFPYPGLRPFKRDESDIFRGRNNFVTELSEKLANHHFIAVVGDSGCGKSSLVRAGLLARLNLALDERHWRTANLRPGNDPFCNMSIALLRDTNKSEKLALRKEYLRYRKIKPEDAISTLRSELRGDLEKSYQILEKILPENHNLLIIVDQFEELFRHLVEDKEVDDFIQWLLTSCQASAYIYVVITMRSEFSSDCARYEGLTEAINQGYFQVPYLNREQLKESIELPARMCDGDIEPEVVERLLADVETMGKVYRSDQLPLLQYILVRMWLKIHDSDPKVLSLRHYEEVGGNLAATLDHNAQRIYTDFSDNDKKITEILFRRLSQRDKKNNYIRHPTKLKEVAILANVSWQAVSDLVDHFRRIEHRFLFSPNKPSSSYNYLREEDMIDITHESVIRQWNNLKKWADDEAEWADFYQRWEKDAKLWQEKKGELWHKLDLDNALNWVSKFQKLYPNEKQLKEWSRQYGTNFELAWQFLAESKRQREQERKLAKQAKQHEAELEYQKKTLKHQKKTLAISLISLIIVSILVIWGLWERQNALLIQQQVIHAQQQAERSEQSRTESLFESYRQRAAWLARFDNYAAARKILNQTYPLDPKIPNSHRHARNLLASFIALKSGQVQQEYQGAEAALYALALSPDEQKLAAVGEQGTVLLFEVKTGALFQRFSEHHENNTIRSVVFHPQGKWLATAGDDKQIILWSLDGKLIRKWLTDSETWALAIDTTGNLLASGGTDNIITMRNLSTNQERTWKGHQDAIAGLAFSPNGELLASASYDKTARLWRVNDGKELYQLSAHVDKVQQVVFSPDGKLLATGSDDETINLWQVETGKNIARLKGHQNKILGITFTAEGRHLVSASADLALRLWDIASGVTLRVLQGHTAFITDVTTDGQSLFSSSTDGTIKRWETTLPYQYTLNLSEPPTATAIAPDGKQVAIGFKNGLVQGYSLPLSSKPIWQLAKEEIHTCSTNDQKCDIQRLALSANGQFLASASLDKTAKVWQIQKDKLTLIKEIPHQAGVNAVAFSPNNKILLTASYDGKIGLFKLGSPEKIRFYSLHEGEEMNSVMWDASGDYVLTASDHITHLWQTRDLLATTSPQPLQTYPPTSATTFWAALSPNAKQVAIVGRYFTINVYPTKLQMPYQLFGHQNTVIRALFSPDSQQLATVSGDNTVRFWDLLQQSELFTITLPTKGKNMVWDFDFRCFQTSCWVAIPLSRENQLLLYELSTESKSVTN
jgi:WD40 repeat protein